MAIRVGVDVGGTFTDFVSYDEESGEVRVAKGLTTPESPDVGVVGVLTEALSGEQLSAANLFLHGTTVGSNALIERKGAGVGLLTTRGFRDILETRRGERDAMYDMLWKAPPPLVPRWLRLPVTERIRADGTIETTLDEYDVREAAAVFACEGVESVAIIFINAYANPVHELRARDVLRAAGFGGGISLSHEVSGEYREYERSSTTVVDAYVRPLVSNYLRALENKLADRGFAGDCLVTRSGGGSMLFRAAEDRPFETVMSGPVAGAVESSALCRDLGLDQAISVDVGGTTFDTCLIVKGKPLIKYEGRIAGMPLQTPWVDVRSIGAGGGSIAYVDEGGLLVVGPQSAGAVPGPVCYQRGGLEPTVTDAAVVLGMLAFGDLAGDLMLDVDASRAALSKLGERLGLDADAAARGVLTIMNSAMANAIRSATFERGQDPREATLIAFGGAGPLLATLLARELGVREIVVPKYAGNFSAWGLLGQDVTRSAALTSIQPLDSEGLRNVNNVLRDLFARLERETSAPAGMEEAVNEAALDLRYLGQEYTLTVSLQTVQRAIAVSANELRERFERDYERTFGHTLSEPIEVVSVRAAIRNPLPRKLAETSGGGVAELPAERRVDAYSFTEERRMPFRAIQRSSLDPGSQVEGPAIILEETTTTYLDAGFQLHVHKSGVLFLTGLQHTR